MFNETSYNTGLGELGMSFSELVNAALGAGCSPSGAQTAAAIAMAESSGNPGARNPVPPDDSYGLWQINMLGKLGPARRSQFGLTSNADLYQADVNARAMAAVSGGCKNWSPWTTYTSGAYKKFLQQLTGGSSSSGGGSVTSSSPEAEISFLDTGMFSGIPGWGLAGAAALVAAYFLLK